MSKRTVLNEVYKGLVESMSIPAEVHHRNGKKYASFGTVVPIHCCTPEQVKFTMVFLVVTKKRNTTLKKFTTNILENVKKTSRN